MVYYCTITPEINMKYCGSCATHKEESEFYKNKAQKDGLATACKTCAKAASRKSHHKRAKREGGWKWMGSGASTHEGSLLYRAKQRAKDKGVPFDLKLEDIVIPDVCPVLGIPMTRGEGVGSQHDGSPSLDRLVPEHGYVRWNVVVISLLANRIKNSATREQVQQVADWMGEMGLE